MRLTVVVVSYNTVDLLEHCLRSIEGQLPSASEILVVDNASSDGSAAMVRTKFPRVQLIENQLNGGFGSACNQAIRASTGQYVALVNPDCEVLPDSLEGLVRFLEDHPHGAVAGGCLRYPDGSFQHSSFRFPTLTQIFLDFFPINWRLTESRLNGRYPKGWDTTAFEIDHPLGAFLCVRRSAADAVGLFDETFFMYVEEVDWCYRFKRAGWQVWHCPDAMAIHHGGRSTRQRASAMFVQLQRSRLLFYRKHYPRWFRVAARGIVAAGMIKTALANLLAELRAGQALPERRQYVRACFEVMRL
jgi:N-acetylglucosaminyl-diphospho-decaprenol L-rhamnosyltransferase